MRGETLQTQHNEKYIKHYRSLAWASSAEDYLKTKSLSYLWCQDKDLVTLDWRTDINLPEIPSHISGAVARMGHHPHQQRDSWNCVVRLLRYLSQQQQNQEQNRLTNNVMAVITYLDDIIVIVNRT